jgi:hypothetical protein
VAWNLKPRFEIVSPALYTDPKDLVLGAQYKTKLSNMTGLKELSQDTVEVFCMLRYLLTEKEKVAAQQGSEIMDAEFQSLELYSHHLMHRLIALVQYKNPNFSKRSQNALIFKLFGNAGLAHIFLFTIKTPSTAPLSILLSTRIRTTLGKINIPSFQIAYPEASFFHHQSKNLSIFFLEC